MTTILVIDQNTPTEQEYSQLAGDDNNLHFVSATTGAEGLRLASDKDPDLILLTAQLEQGNWLDILQDLKRKAPNSPVILTSSRESAREAVTAFRAGACDYVRKPIEPAEMEETIQRALRTAQLGRERERLAEMLAEATETVSRHQQELNAVHVIGRLTTSLLDLDVVLDRLTEIALHMTDAQESMLLLLDEDREQLHLHTGKNLRPELADGFTKQLNDSAARRAIRTGQPVLVTGDEAILMPQSPAEALLYVPVRAPDHVVGLLTLCSRRQGDVFSKQDIVLLSTLVDYAAVAIQNARLFESIAESKSLMDSVFSSVASGVLTVDRDGKISLINRAAKRMLQAPDACQEAPLADVCPRVAEELGPFLDATRQEGEVTGPFEIDLPLSSGAVANLRATLSPLRQGNEAKQGVTIVLEDVTRQRRLESRFRLLQRYLSPTVIERLPDDPQELELGGVRREVACLFADLRGFVDFCSRHPPESLVQTLNQYLGLGAQAIMAEDGTLDKFVGDAVLAFFNAPLPQENYVLRAARAAFRIRESTNDLHRRLDPAHRLTFGMGISVGEAIVGNIGTPQRLDYTAIGPSVNIANRLQAAAEPGQILLTPQVYERIKDHVVARPLSLNGIAGPDGAYRAYELLDLS